MSSTVEDIAKVRPIEVLSVAEGVAEVPFIIVRLAPTTMRMLWLLCLCIVCPPARELVWRQNPRCYPYLPLKSIRKYVVFARSRAKSIRKACTFQKYPLVLSRAFYRSKSKYTLGLFVKYKKIPRKTYTDLVLWYLLQLI